jgi:hypothetical protein
MTDERNIAHDKTVAQNKKNHGEAVVENASVVPQPGKKPALIDEDTGPSNSVAHELYKQGEEPRVSDEAKAQRHEKPAADDAPDTQA